MVPAIQRDNVHAFASTTSHFCFLFPAMLNITLHSSYDLEERLSQGLGQQGYSVGLF